MALMKLFSTFLAAAFFALGSSAKSAPAAEPPVTLQSLLEELIDFGHVARWPQPEFTCKQASSYDRASTTPDDPKTWFANGDQNQFIRIEHAAGRTEKVMMDADGPGAIVRFWITSDNRKKGTIRIYLDGKAKPAVTVPSYDFTNNDALPAGPPLLTSHPGAEPNGRGGNTLFLPIPYARHCKVTWEEGEQPPGSRYYQINYRTYPPGTNVETYSPAALEAAKQLRKRVNETLAHPPLEAQTNATETEQTIEPGQEMPVPLPPGPASVRRLELNPGTTDAQTLRSLVLLASFDNEETIWCPVSDFFGSGVGLNELHSWYRTVEKAGAMTCRWVMPYRQSGRLVLHNFGKTTPRVKLSVNVRPWNWDDRSMHFHANWRQQYPLATRPMSDWNYLTATGRGVYVGDTLGVMNPVPAWWGEGDEKVWVDGESFPSHFGTGSEDYYCYSWSDTRLFQTPFANQVRCDGPGNKGQTVVTRTRSLDAIPFTRSLKFDMEVWHWADCKVAYAATTYWYGCNNAMSNRGPEPAEAARPIPESPPPYHIAGAIECEKLKIVAKSKDTPTEVQSGGLAEGEWSGGAALGPRQQAGRVRRAAFPRRGARPAEADALRDQKLGLRHFAVHRQRPIRRQGLRLVQPAAHPQRPDRPGRV